jgi:GGDEF domain-containing protein
MKSLRSQSEEIGHVTLSAGICPDDGKQRSASEMFAEADRALYDAKAAGRNCIRIAKCPSEPLSRRA